MTAIRGVRGAITIEADDAERIIEATQTLLTQMIASNDIQEEQVASVFFTVTPDLTAAYPARAARLLGWTQVALMGMQEMNVPGGLPRCIRVLIHWNTEKPLNEIHHVYLNDAVKLRPDLQNGAIVGKETL